MKKREIKNSGMVFGVFDGLHEGHKYFLSEAAKLAENITVVLTLSETAMLLKGRTPWNSYEERERALGGFNRNLKIIPSDAMPGEWKVFRDGKPDLAILGYDQQSIAKELEKMKIPFIFIGSHYPEKYKSSLLKGKSI